MLFAAGKPKYLEHEDVTEGEVLERAFCIRTGRYPVTFGKFKTHIFSENRRTEDDVRSAIDFAADHDLHAIAFITVGVHIPRVQAFVETIGSLRGDALPAIAVGCLASENLLSERDSRYAKLFRAVEASAAYERTKRMEEAGIKALRAGRYKVDG